MRIEKGRQGVSKKLKKGKKNLFKKVSLEPPDI